MGQWETPSVEEAQARGTYAYRYLGLVGTVTLTEGVSRRETAGLSESDRQPRVVAVGDQNEAVNVSSVKDIHSVDDHRAVGGVFQTPPTAR